MDSSATERYRSGRLNSHLQPCLQLFFAKALHVSMEIPLLAWNVLHAISKIFYFLPLQFVNELSD